MYALKDGYIIKVYDKDKNIIWDAENHDITLCHQIMKDIHTNMEKKRPGLKGSFSTYHYTLSQDNKIAGYADISYYGPYYFSESDFQFLDSLNQILFITGISSLILAVIAGMLLAKRLSVPLTKQRKRPKRLLMEIIRSDMAQIKPIQLHWNWHSLVRLLTIWLKILKNRKKSADS